MSPAEASPWANVATALSQAEAPRLRMGGRPGCPEPARSWPSGRSPMGLQDTSRCLTSQCPQAISNFLRAGAGAVAAAGYSPYGVTGLTAGEMTTAGKQSPRSNSQPEECTAPAGALQGVAGYAVQVQQPALTALPGARLGTHPIQRAMDGIGRIGTC